ncbi:MAG: PQQ-binding-like beta-propeller repeat protein [Flavitalea sp.]
MHFVSVICITAGFLISASGDSFTTVETKAIYPSAADTTKRSGREIFITACSSCHRDSSAILAPGTSVLSAMTPRMILTSLQTGKMQVQGKTISDEEKQTVAEYLTGQKIKESSMPSTAYEKFSISNKPANPTEHSGWGNDLAATGFRSTAASRITKQNVGSLNLKWSFAFPDAAMMRTKPAIIDNWMLIGTQFGEVYALNRYTGKIGWIFNAGAAIRGAITVQRTGKKIIAYFTDFSTNTYALDVLTGKAIWSKRAGFETMSSTTGSVAVANGLVLVPITSVEVSAAVNGNYPCCFSSGGLVAIDASTGTVKWTHRVIEEKAKAAGTKKNGKPFYGPAGAPVWSSPTVDLKRGLVYIGTGENYSNPTTGSSDAIQAINLKTGKLVWNFQATDNDAYNTACPVFVNCPEKSGPDLDFGMSPMIVKTTAGKELLVVGQKSGIVFGISPENGKKIWSLRVGKGGMLGGIHWGMASDGKQVFAANADNMNAIDKRDSSVKPSPGLFAIDPLTGKLNWSYKAPACDQKFCFNGNSAAPVSTTGLVFAGSLDGMIRAHDANSGEVLWEFNTAITYEDVNGIKGKGGSIDGPAPVLADGYLYVNSGYGAFGQAGGNMLLAFEVRK